MVSVNVRVIVQALWSDLSYKASVQACHTGGALGEA